MTDILAAACPVPLLPTTVQMGHGGGGRDTQSLIEAVFLKALGNPFLEARHDGALLPGIPGSLAFTTDSFVIRPLVFPGGDIGKLAVCGTVNDLLMCGARPLWLGAAFILEEGLPLDTLRRVVESMGRAAREAGVAVVTGDTKVVERGRADGIYITTSGIGQRLTVESDVCPAAIRPGDAILLSGDIGRHGISILASREGLELESTVESDCGALTGPVLKLFEAGLDVHCLRDLTRGGLAAALSEIAGVAGARCEVREAVIPVREDVRSACELLGLDPLIIANEGRFVCFLPKEQAETALQVLRGEEMSQGAVLIGEVRSAPSGEAVLCTPLGTHRVIEPPAGELLPRIC